MQSFDDQSLLLQNREDCAKSLTPAQIPKLGKQCNIEQKQQTGGS